MSRPHGRTARLRAAGLAVLLALAVAVAACGGGGDKSSSSSSSGSGSSAQKKDPKDVHLAMITATTTQNAFQEMALGAQAAGAAEGISLKSAAPNGINGPQEVALFQAAMQTSKDGIATMTTTPDLFVRPFSRAVAQGIPQVSVDTPPPKGSNVTTFVGNDNVELGAMLATAMLDKIPEDAKGELVLGNPIPGLPVLDLRVQGMKQVLKEKRPNIKLLGPFNTGPEPTQNYQAWQGIVKAHPNAIAYIDPGDQAVVSLARIEKQTGKKLLVGGADVDPAALAAIKDGRAYALADPEHWLKGYIAIALLSKLGKDGTKMPEGWWNPGGAIITAKNVHEIIARQKDNTTRTQYYQSTVDKQLADPDSYVKSLPG
jgi:ribose transport system substrate-binding protein